MAIRTAPSLPRVKVLRCPACGAPHELHGGPRSQVLVCGYCDTATDLRDETYRTLWKATQKIKFKPLIPLGARGTLQGELLECIGFMRRTQTVDGMDYTWNEYLLFNPCKGYRWIVEYNGHWSYVRECMALPVGTDGPVATDPPYTWVRHGGEEFKHFASYNARVTYVLGEFYWEVRLGESTGCTDYVAPPRMLSAEISNNEIIWSVGDYIDAREIWAAFKLEGTPLPPVGVGANQPSPFSYIRRLWLQCWLFVSLAFLLTLLFTMACPGSQVADRTFEYNANAKDHVQVIPPATPGGGPQCFEVTGRTCNLEIKVWSDGIDNRWAWYPMILINDQTNEATEFALSTEYYHGVSEGESWSEGDRGATAVVPAVPAGRYYIITNPQSGTGSEPEKFNPNQPTPGPVTFRYQVTVKRDVTYWTFFWWVLFLLLPLPIIQGLRASAFENRRWEDSDHPRTSSS